MFKQPTLRFLLITSTLILLQVLAQTSDAQVHIQLTGSNLICNNGILGPSIDLLMADGSLSAQSFAGALTKARAGQLATLKAIKATKKAIASRQSVAKNKKKLKQLQVTLATYMSIESAILQCESLAPLTSALGLSGLVSSAFYQSLSGSVIYAADGTFLGEFSNNKFSSDSIANPFGQHGSEFGSASIFNSIGIYGSSVSPLSAFNPVSVEPPVIFVDDEPVAFLTTNSVNSPRVDPREVASWLGR